MIQAADANSTKIPCPELPVLSVCHLLVDGICAAVLFRHGEVSIADAILIYNTFAFTTQCLTGMLPDKFGRGKMFVLISALILLAGVVIPMPVIVQAVVIGLGNSLFHVSGGWITLRKSNTMGPLGVFVAPGAIGLFLGKVYPALCLPFAVLLIVLSVVLMKLPESPRQTKPGQAIADCREPEAPSLPAESKELGNTERVLLAGMLLVAVAARAVGGSSVAFEWKTTTLAAGILVFAVFLGKTAGGIVSDRIGLMTTAAVSVIIASVTTMYFPWSMPLSLIGQFMLNLSMPITLYLIYNLFPDSPGFAFGLAASALWPGTLVGKLIHLTGSRAGILAVLCFMTGLAAIYITERRLKK